MADIEKLLSDLRSRVEGYGSQYGLKETADDFLKITYAKLYEDAPAGSVAERDAWVRRQAEYVAAVERKRDLYADFKASETYIKLLLAEVEVWRSKQANARFIDKAHT